MDVVSVSPYPLDALLPSPPMRSTRSGGMGAPPIVTPSRPRTMSSFSTRSRITVGTPAALVSPWSRISSAPCSRSQRYMVASFAPASVAKHSTVIPAMWNIGKVSSTPGCGSFGSDR